MQLEVEDQLKRLSIHFHCLLKSINKLKRAKTKQKQNQPKEENDNFFSCFVCYLEIYVYLCSVRGAFNPARDTSLIPARDYSGFFIASILSFPMQYISLNCLYCDVPFRPENFSYPSSNISWLKLSFGKNNSNS